MALYNVSPKNTIQRVLRSKMKSVACCEATILRFTLFHMSLLLNVDYAFALKVLSRERTTILARPRVVRIVGFNEPEGCYWSHTAHPRNW